MSKCTSIDPLVTPYVDGELPPDDRTLVDEHLHRCSPCHERVAAEGAVRELLHDQKGSLTAERAPTQLRKRCGELATGSAAQNGSAGGHPLSDLGSPADASSVRSGSQARPGLLAAVRARVGTAPFALAAAFILIVAGVFLYQATDRSSRVLAVELAADHVKCFAVNSLLGTHDAPEAVESSMLAGFGWHLQLPEEFSREGLELVGARQCLYAEGKVAHLMYRDHGRPVSIFMLPGSMRPDELVDVLGHEAAIWSTGNRTFVVVTRGTPADVERVAALVKGAIQ